MDDEYVRREEIASTATFKGRCLAKEAPRQPTLEGERVLRVARVSSLELINFDFGKEIIVARNSCPNDT